MRRRAGDGAGRLHRAASVSSDSGQRQLRRLRERERGRTVPWLATVPLLLLPAGRRLRRWVRPPRQPEWRACVPWQPREGRPPALVDNRLMGFAPHTAQPGARGHAALAGAVPAAGPPAARPTVAELGIETPPRPLPPSLLRRAAGAPVVLIAHRELERDLLRRPPSLGRKLLSHRVQKKR